MKAYQIKIELQDSEPLIWRRVIMPAGATFNRLHDVIQNVTNFSSGYPYEDYHLFDFDLPEENIRVTNDEEAYQEHLHFKKNRIEIDGAETAPPEDVGGIPGYYEFLKIYNDEKHSEHKEIKDWAPERAFRQYDPVHINVILKLIKYKKNEKV